MTIVRAACLLTSCLSLSACALLREQADCSARRLEECRTENERINCFVSLVDSGVIAKGEDIGLLRTLVPEDRLEIDWTLHEGVALVDLSDRGVPREMVSFGWTGWYAKIWYLDDKIAYYLLANIHKSMMTVEMIENSKEFRQLFQKTVDEYRRGGRASSHQRQPDKETTHP